VDLLMALTPPGKFNLSFPTETETGGGEKFFFLRSVSLFFGWTDSNGGEGVVSWIFAESAVVGRGTRVGWMNVMDETGDGDNGVGLPWVGRVAAGWLHVRATNEACLPACHCG
jgi:hypothetical protein